MLLMIIRQQLVLPVAALLQQLVLMDLFVLLNVGLFTLTLRVLKPLTMRNRCSSRGRHLSERCIRYCGFCNLGENGVGGTKERLS